MCSYALLTGPSGSQNTSCPQHRGRSLDLSNARYFPEDVHPFPKAGLGKKYQIEENKEEKQLS
jgi:hypothetical protein